MKRLIVTDTHLGLYSDSDAWLEIVLNFFKYIAKYCYKNNINEIFHLGDFFDNRKSLNTKTQNTAHRIAKILEKINNLHTFIIVGNHDCYYKNQINPNTLELFKKYKNIHVIDEITQWDDIIMAPWGTFPLDEPEQAKDKYLFGHFAINGFYMNDSYKCTNGTDKAQFKHFKKVLSGHFHTPSSNNNIIYPGSPYGQTFHDAGGIRGFHIFEDGNLEFIEYKDAPKFVKLFTSSEMNENDIKGNIVRIIFSEDYGTTKNQEIIDNVLKCKPFLYSVNYANIESEEKEDDDDMSVMDTKEEIVESYIDSTAFPVNIQIGMLKSMFMKLMKEVGTGIKSRSADGTKIISESVGFQNFLSFGSKWQDIPLYKGVNFVTGIDVDKGKSNGAGKSSFLETIPFALFGKTARDIKQDQIINWKNKKNCEVVFRFKIDDALYEVKRGLKPNTLLFYKDGNTIEEEAHKADYQKMFEEIFGMDDKMFMSLIHSNINNSANIMNMKKPEKRKFLERMFGLEIFSKMNELANSKLRNVEEKRYKITTDLTSCDDKINNSLNLKSKFFIEIKSKQESIESLKEIGEKLKKLKENNPTIEDDVNNLSNKIKDKRESFHKVTLQFETWKTKLDAEVEHLKKEIKEIENQEEQRKKNDEIRKRIEAIEQKAGKIDDVQSKIDGLHNDERTVSTENESQFIKISDIEKEIAIHKTDLKNVENSLELISEGICPVCGQNVEDPQTHYKKEQEDLKKKIDKKEKSLASLKKKKMSTLDKLTEIRKKIETLSKTKDTIYKLNSELKEVGSEEKKDELIKDKNDKIENIEEAWKIYKKKEEKHSNEVESMKNKLEDLMAEQSIINSKQREYDLAESQAKSEQKHIESLEKMIKEQDEEIEKTNERKKILEDNKLKLNDITDYLNCIKDILKDENIKQFTIKRIMPFLNKQVNYYLSEVNYSFFVKIDKWLDIDIKGPGIRNASYENLSGGERRGIDISLQLSLLDVARTQAGIFPDILIFDELLDSSIDSRGINELMKIVKVKQKEFDGKIFIISHRDEIDADLVDNQYKAVKKNGFSEIIY